MLVKQNITKYFFGRKITRRNQNYKYLSTIYNRLFLPKKDTKTCIALISQIKFNSECATAMILHLHETKLSGVTELWTLSVASFACMSLKIETCQY